MPASLAASTRLMPSSALAIASTRSAARRFASCRAFRRSPSGVRSSRIGSAAPIAPSRSPPFAGGSYRVTFGKSVHAIGGMSESRPRREPIESRWPEAKRQRLALRKDTQQDRRWEPAHLVDAGLGSAPNRSRVWNAGRFQGQAGDDLMSDSPAYGKFTHFDLTYQLANYPQNTAVS